MPVDEGAVQFELSHGEPAQVGERRDARPEVVDGHDDPEVSELLDHPPGRLELSMTLVSVISRTSPEEGSAVPVERLGDEVHEAGLEQVRRERR